MDHKMSRSPWVIHYDGSSCNGCDIEVLASLTPLFDAERFGVVNTGNPKHADIFFGDGFGQCPEPARRAPDLQPDARAQVRGGLRYLRVLGRRVPRCLQRDWRRGPRDSVDVYAPGCAIRPETVIDAIVEACGILDQKEAVMRAGGDPLTVGGAATWDGGVELGEDGFVAAAGAGADGAGDAPAETRSARRCKGGRVMQKAIYATVGIDELLSHVQALKGVGARFVQMHAERCVDDGSYRLVYTFINVRAAQENIAQDGSYAIENLVVEGIDQYQEIPSISSYYPAVFPFENEAHDLFGLAITDMQIDFKGFFLPGLDCRTHERYHARGEGRTREGHEGPCRRRGQGAQSRGRKRPPRLRLLQGRVLRAPATPRAPLLSPLRLPAPMLSTMRPLRRPRSRLPRWRQSSPPWIPRKRPRSARRLPLRPPATSRKKEA